MRSGKGARGFDDLYPDFASRDIDYVYVQFTFEQNVYGLARRTLVDNRFSFRMVL